jgi:hypothetical protein
MLRMKERITISIEPEAIEIARAEVEQGRAPNLSAAIERLVRKEARHQSIREWVRMWEKEFGPIREEEREWARRELMRAWSEISSSTQER